MGFIGLPTCLLGQAGQYTMAKSFARMTPSLLSSATRSEGKSWALIVYTIFSAQVSANWRVVMGALWRRDSNPQTSIAFNHSIRNWPCWEILHTTKCRRRQILVGHESWIGTKLEIGSLPNIQSQKKNITTPFPIPLTWAEVSFGGQKITNHADFWRFETQFEWRSRSTNAVC